MLHNNHRVEADTYSNVQWKVWVGWCYVQMAMHIYYTNQWVT